MKNIVLFALTLLMSTSCALRKVERGGQSGQRSAGHSGSTNLSKNSKQSSNSEQSEKKKGESELRTRAVFHVIEPLGVQLLITNMDKKVEETILMDKTLSSLELSPGFWQVSGFILDGKRYKRMNTTKQFIFEVKKNKYTYVGSYIFQCPKVNQNYLREMKKMNFFNRYPYTSATAQRLCELIVGSDYENVNRVWLTVDESQQNPLSLGF